MLTKEQCRAARSLLGMKQMELADACGLSKTAITNFESGTINARQDTQKTIREAFEQRGVEFIGDYGVQKRQASFTVMDIRGENHSLPDLWNDIFETLKDKGGEVLISHLEEGAAYNAHPEELTHHLKRLKEHNITERLLVCEGDNFFIQDKDCYRWLPKDLFRAGITSFIYDNKIALQFWTGSLILIINHAQIAAEERKRFEHLWSLSKTPN